MNRDEEWNVSFAGCGFRSVYYLGAASCILQRVPQLLHGAARICGASSGCLVAAALTVGIPVGKLTGLQSVMLSLHANSAQVCRTLFLRGSLNAADQTQTE